MKSCDQVRLRSAKNIVDEMEFLYHKYKNNSFRFTDPTFEDPGEQGVQKASEVFREIKKRNLSVSMHVFSRVENVIKLNDQYFQQGYDAGLDCIYVGIESGNAEDLKLYNKPTTVQNNQKALQIIRRNHIHASFGFINFNPYSTYERLIQNAEFLYHSGLGHVFYLYQTRLEVLPTVPIKTKLIRENLMAPGANYKTDFYDYKFADPQMGVFFRAVKAAYPKTPIYYMDTLCGIYRSWFKRRNQDDQELNSIFKELETMQNTLRDINHELFSNMLEMHRKGCDYNEFLAYIQGHPIDNYHEDYEKLYKKINIRVKKSVFKEIMSK